MASIEPSFFIRNEFLIRRLHSLTGLVFGGYMMVHLLTNASILGGAAMFQKNVLAIHGFGPALVVLEWGLIFLPILFHAIVGILLLVGMVPNNYNYPFEANWRYTAQRVSAVILVFFILYHVFHMHGWFHFDWWLAMAEPLGGAQFRPYNAGSSAGLALQNLLVALFYAIGVVAGVFHFVNGIWTAGITWGVWTRPAAMRRALAACMGLGVLLLAVGLGALWGMRQVGTGSAYAEAMETENRMYHAAVEAGAIMENEHKRTAGHESDDSGAQGENE